MLIVIRQYKLLGLTDGERTNMQNIKKCHATVTHVFNKSQGSTLFYSVLITRYVCLLQ